MSRQVERPRRSEVTNFSLIQALRGLAALWVVLFHLDKRETITARDSKREIDRALKSRNQP